MVTRVEQALNNIRAALSDIDGDRWSDNQLISYIDKAQKELCKSSGDLKTTYSIDIVEGEYAYTLPDNVIRINRVEYKRKELPFRPIDKLERVGLDHGEPEYALFDKLRRDKIVLYPTPNTPYEENNADLSVYVTILPSTISNKQDEFEISPVYDIAIEFYTCYMALIANQDTVSLQIANEYKNNYIAQLRLLLADTSVNYKTVGRTSNYKGFV